MRVLGRTRTILWSCKIAASAASTALAGVIFSTALRGATFVPLATVVAAACASYLQYMQVEYSIVKYNQLLSTLRNLRSWWTALGDARDDPAMKDHLVESTEKVLEAENTGWARQMSDALAHLPKKEER